MHNMKSKIRTEVHTHTCVSQHAYSTLGELIATCREKGIELLAITDHAPGIPDGAHPWHFANMKVFPRRVGDITLLRGCEVDIIDYEGRIDLGNFHLDQLDWVIASIHPPCLVPGTVEQHTNAYLGALANPRIHCLGHSGTAAYPYDIETVVEAAKAQNKVIELNNHSFFNRKKSIENCEKIALACARIGTKVCITTDAHIAFELGDTEKAWQMAEKAGIRQEQIVNLTRETMLSYLCEYKGCDRSYFE